MLQKNHMNQINRIKKCQYLGHRKWDQDTTKAPNTQVYRKKW